MSDGGLGVGAAESGTGESSLGAETATGPPSVRRSAAVHGAERSLTATWPGPGGGVALVPGLSSLPCTLSIRDVGQQVGGRWEAEVLDSPHVNDVV